MKKKILIFFVLILGVSTIASGVLLGFFTTVSNVTVVDPLFEFDNTIMEDYTFSEAVYMYPGEERTFIHWINMTDTNYDRLSLNISWQNAEPGLDCYFEIYYEDNWVEIASTTGNWKCGSRNFYSPSENKCRTRYIADPLLKSDIYYNNLTILPD